MRSTDLERPNFDFGFNFGYEDDAEDSAISSFVDKVMGDANKFVSAQVPKNTRKKTESVMKKFFLFLIVKERAPPSFAHFIRPDKCVGICAGF